MAINLTYTFANLTKVFGSYFDSNFTAIVNFINGNTNGSNWKIADNALKVGGFAASQTPAAGEVVVLGSDGYPAVPVKPIQAGDIFIGGTNSLALGNVVAGDVYEVFYEVEATIASATVFASALLAFTGTAVVWGRNGVQITSGNQLCGQSIYMDFAAVGANKQYLTMSTVIQVYSDGTLTLSISKGAIGTAPTYTNEGLKAICLKKKA